MSRKDLVDNYRIQLKKNVYKLKKAPLLETSVFNKVAPFDAFKPKSTRDEDANLFEMRNNTGVEFKPGRMSSKINVKRIVKHEELKQIKEADNSQEFSFSFRDNSRFTNNSIKDI